MIPKAIFSHEEAERAFKDWGANCGPGAIAAITGMTLNQLRPYLGNFEQKKYTNTRLMYEILNRLEVTWLFIKGSTRFPKNGLARIQWEGSWTDLGKPRRARYRHTHWVASHQDKYTTWIFDINCMCVGGWVSYEEWSTQVVPWLLPKIEPNANGIWHVTHAIEVKQLRK